MTDFVMEAKHVYKTYGRKTSKKREETCSDTQTT